MGVCRCSHFHVPLIWALYALLSLQTFAADIEIQANEILHHKLTLNGYLAEFTGLPSLHQNLHLSCSKMMIKSGEFFHHASWGADSLSFLHALL